MIKNKQIQSPSENLFYCKMAKKLIFFSKWVPHTTKILGYKYIFAL
jgi:hypothetical protein